MDLIFIIVCIGYVLFVAGLVSIPLKQKKVMAMAGECLYGFPKKRTGYIVGVEILSFVLITLNLFIRYSFFVSLILCACGVLAGWIIIGEAALGPKYGLYEKGIVAVGKFIDYDDIVTFPVLNLPKKEQENYPKNVLVIASRKYGNLEIAFDSDDVCKNVMVKLKEMGFIK